MIDCGQIGNDYIEQLRAWAKRNFVPLTATFELTPFCNFDCVMCYVHLTKEAAEKQGKLLTADEWIEIAQQAKNMGTLNLSLTGGEPFLHPEFWKIYEELNKMGFLISVLSNGSMIDESVMEKFRKYGMPYMVKLTLYGASDETYQRTCNSPNGFTRFTKAVDLLKDAGVPLSITSTIVKENVDDLQDIYRFARERNLPLQHTITVVKSSRGSINTIEKSRFNFDDYCEKLTLDDLEKSKFPSADEPFSLCGSFGNSFWMTWHGHLQMCSFMNLPDVPYSGNLNSDFKKLNEMLLKLRNPVECAKCQYKTFCQRCPGILCGESGHPEKTTDRICSLARRFFELYKTKKEN